jgi:GxxExxY protein
LDFSDDHGLTEKIIGCAMKVHRQLGPGFLESVYRNALAFELRRAGLAVQSEKYITVKYEHVIVGDFVADLVVDETLICELKAAVALSKADEVQLVNYLTATNHELGLLLNFGSESLQFKRKHRRKLSNLEDVDFRNPVNPKNPVHPV